MVPGLKAPVNLKIDFAPSERQYEVWKNLQPECPLCGGEVVQRQQGLDRNGNPTFVSVCEKCGNDNIPQIILSGGSAGGGKAAMLDSTICTPRGFKKLREIKEGDEISDPLTGGIQKVVHLHPIGNFDFYRIKFEDGTHFDCSEGHLWNARITGNDNCENKERTEWSAVQMHEWCQRKKEKGLSESYLEIPLCAPIQFVKKYISYPIAPYLFGAIVGNWDGGNSIVDGDTIRIVSKDKNLVKHLIANAENSILNIVPGIEGAPTQYTIKLKKISNTLKGLESSNTKNLSAPFIPKRYAYSSIEDRTALICGIMNTGGIIENDGYMAFSTSCESLANSVASIIRSLGGLAIVAKHSSEGYKNGNGDFIECAEHYSVRFKCKTIFNSQREWRNTLVEASTKRITDVEYIGTKEGQCITVSNPSGLYIVDDFTVTHNSYLGSCWLVSTCMRWPDMRMVVGRKTLKSLRESTWNTIQKVVKSWGLEEGVNYKINNLSGEMIFWNGSRIIMKEMAYSPSDPDYLRFGSSEFSGAFLDEVGELDQKGVDVLFSRIRWNVANTTKVPKMLMSTNPCLGWVRDRFVLDENSEPVVCRPNEMYIPFSVYDNPDKNFVNAYVSALYKISDPSVRERLLFGNWLYVDVNDAACYWNFDGSKHLVDGLKEKVYDPLKPIILSFDFNTSPYMSCLAFQVNWEKKEIYVLEEILGLPKDKENNTPQFAYKIRQKYLKEQHSGGLIITGDPAGLQRSSQTADGVNNFTILQSNLSDPLLRPQKKILPKQPGHVVRLEFVNKLFEGYEGWSVQIDLRCRKFTEDLVYQKKESDGTKKKHKIMDPKLGVKYEKYGHLSDCFDLFCCTFIDKAWKKYRTAQSSIVTVPNSTIVYGVFDY